jgi:hypothetical protein
MIKRNEPGEKMFPTIMHDPALNRMPCFSPARPKQLSQAEVEAWEAVARAEAICIVPQLLSLRTGEGSSDKEKRALSPLRNSSPIVNRPSCLRDVEKVRED